MTGMVTVLLSKTVSRTTVVLKFEMRVTYSLHPPTKRSIYDLEVGVCKTSVRSHNHWLMPTLSNHFGCLYALSHRTNRALNRRRAPSVKKLAGASVMLSTAGVDESAREKDGIFNPDDIRWVRTCWTAAVWLISCLCHRFPGLAVPTRLQVSSHGSPTYHARGALLLSCCA